MTNQITHLWRRPIILRRKNVYQYAARHIIRALTPQSVLFWRVNY